MTAVLDISSGALKEARAITSPHLEGRLPVLSRRTTLDQPSTNIVDATFLATAHGIYEVRLNGAAITDTVLNPGWTVYESRLQVQRFDVTTLMIQLGGTELEISALVAGGWWNGDLGWAAAEANYGTETAFVGALVLTFEDGTTQSVLTDEGWEARASHLTLASLYNGQREDRRPTSDATHPVSAVDLDRSTLIEQASPYVIRHESLRPQSIWTSPSGKTLVDFGQNLVGWLKFTVTGPTGTEITLRHAEVLEHEELGTRPLRGAEATDSLVLAGDPEGEFFEPTFTFHGFRYAEITGWPGELTTSDLEAVVVHSDITRASWFESSHTGVNQLVENSIWSQRGNFLAVPTDCPQRDERLGWTGDLAVYAATATFQFTVADFLHNWLLDLAAETRLGTAHHIAHVVPDVLKYSHLGHDPASDRDPQEIPTAIWGDAAVWVPQALWDAYGDLDRLREQYPGMVLHLESVERALSPSGLWDTGFQFGDWLDPDAPADDPSAAKADKGVVATACLVRSARFAAEAAGVIGKDAEARRWQDLADRTLAAFTENYVDSDGRIQSDCVTVYALAIAFDLLDEGTRALAGDRLADLVHEARYRVSTGFAGTPFVTWALSETGHVEDAYRLLLEEHHPSWLYPVSMGATTIWERWDSMLPDGSINPGGMTSFNHYALGAVANWIYQVVLGISPAAPGYSEVRIRPTPGPGIDWARGAYDSASGRIEVSWQQTPEGSFHLDIALPDDLPAVVILPDGTEHRVTGGSHRY